MTRLKAALLVLALIVIGAGGGAAFFYVRSLEHQRDRAVERAAAAARAQGQLETANASLRADLNAARASVWTLKDESDKLRVAIEAGLARANGNADMVLKAAADISLARPGGQACEARLQTIGVELDRFMTRLMAAANGR